MSGPGSGSGMVVSVAAASGHQELPAVASTGAVGVSAAVVGVGDGLEVGDGEGGIVMAGVSPGADDGVIDVVGADVQADSHRSKRKIQI